MFAHAHVCVCVWRLRVAAGLLNPTLPFFSLKYFLFIFIVLYVYECFARMYVCVPFICLVSKAYTAFLNVCVCVYVYVNIGAL